MPLLLTDDDHARIVAQIDIRVWDRIYSNFYKNIGMSWYFLGSYILDDDLSAYLSSKSLKRRRIIAKALKKLITNARIVVPHRIKVLASRKIRLYRQKRRKAQRLKVVQQC